MSKNQSINITFDIIEKSIAHPNDVAVIYRNTQITYKQLDSIIWKGSSFLSKYGMKPGDVIGVHTSSDWNSLILILSIIRMGGTLLSIPPSVPEIQAKEFLSRTCAKFIAGDVKVPFEINIPFLEFNYKIIRNTYINKQTLDVSPRAPWVIVTGSGTTGKPKLIPLTHQVQRYRNEMSHEWLGLQRSDVVASMSHLGFHAPKNRLLETLYSGGSFFLDIYKEKDIFQTANTNLTVLHATVFHIQKLLLLCEKKEPELLSIRALTVGGSSVPFGIKQKIKQFLTSNLIVRYASNETGPIAFISNPDVFQDNNCVGKSLSNINLKILDANRKTPIKDGSGLIALQSPGNFDGYLNDPVLNSTLFTDDGFILGDLGRLDLDGNIYHLGRFDQMMIFNGINIHPVEIERVLLSHPLIDDAASFPIHHSTHQDIPVAAISLKQDSILDERDVLFYCKLRLGSHSPIRIFILNELPRNDRGKIVKADLANEIKKIFYV